jgi:outer membrane protein OmpA-like peptidoglycan-associated protein
MVTIGIRLYDNTIHPIGDIASATGAETTITTIVDYQKKAEVEVLVSDTAYGDTYCSIGTLLIRNLPPSKAGKPRITLKFHLDEDYSLNIYVMSKDVLKKQVNINKNDWEPSLERDEKKAPEILSTIDLSSANVLEPGKIVPEKKDKDKEEIPESKKRDIIIPLLIIASILILIFFAVYFFFVLRPWDSITEGPEPTQLPAATKVIPVDEDVSGTKQDFGSETATMEPDEEIVKENEEESVIPDLDKINTELKSIGPIYFKVNSSTFRDSGERKKIDRISLSIGEYKGYIRLIINGHTAKAGSEDERQDLSLERASVVRKELISRGAISEENCRVEGFGAEIPITSDPKKGNLNRRVELRVEYLK